MTYRLYPVHRCLCLLLLFCLPAAAYLQPIRLKAVSGLPQWKTLAKGQKASIALSRLAEEYRVMRSSGRAGQPFRSKNALAQIADEWVRIEAIAGSDGARLLRALEARGLQEGVAFQRIVNGRLPLNQLLDLRAIEQIPELVKMRLALRPFQRTGAVTSQGDLAQNTDWVRSFFNVDGLGATVGILSDSYDYNSGAAAGIASGDLPGPGNPSGRLNPVNVLQDNGETDEGRAMAEIIHDIAPGADLAFHTGTGGRADFANGIIELANLAFCDVIVDDIGYLNSPFFQDGIIAQAADQVVDGGAVYFSAAGNDSSNSYEGPPNPGDDILISYTDPDTDQEYEFSVTGHDFGSGDYFQSVTIPAEGQVILTLQWTDPFTSISGLPGPQTDIDLFLVSEDEATIIAASVEENNAGGDAIEIISYENTTEGNQNLNLLIGIYDGPTPALMKYIPFGDLTINEFQTFSSTCYGQPNAAGAIAVGASFFSDTPTYGVDPPELEPFSSRGGTPIFFNTNGDLLQPAQVRSKPEVVAPDGGDNTFFGTDFDMNGFFNFFGTSAAAPHAVGIAALLMQLNPELTPESIELALTETAVDMILPGFDFDSGFGLVDGFLAAALSAQCAPDLTLSGNTNLLPYDRFSAQNTITANLEVTSDFSLQASDQINLLPGFVCRAGINFSASIDDTFCEPLELQVRAQPDQNKIFSLPALQDQIQTRTLPPNTWGLICTPNPFGVQATVNFQLPEPQSVSLRITDPAGKTIVNLLEATELASGDHQVNLEGTELPPGFYYIILDTPQGRESSPLIRL